MDPKATFADCLNIYVEPNLNIGNEDVLYLRRKWASDAVEGLGKSESSGGPLKRESPGPAGEVGDANLHPPNGLLYGMVEEVGFPRRKRGEHARASKGAQAKPLKKADAFSRTVTREALDVARYVTDMTAQLEAMAIASRLDLLAYFLGMARAESELFVRTNAAPEADREDDEVYQESESHTAEEEKSFD